MEFLPFDLSSQDQNWVQSHAQWLRDRLENPRSASERKPVDTLAWSTPESPLAAIPLADEILASAVDPDAIAGRPAARSALDAILGRLAPLLVELVHSPGFDRDEPQARLILALAADRAARLYLLSRRFGIQRIPGQWLQVLLASGVASAIRLGVDLLVQPPPSHWPPLHWSDASVAISALVQSNRWSIPDVFPRILDSTQPSVLAPAIDLANLLARDRGVDPHPAAERLEPLLELLGALNQQLAALEENPSRFSNRVADVQRMLFDGVSLSVSLCHLFGLLGDPRAIPKLTQALDLGHRRIKAEAAYALAKLGESRAVDLLIELVEDDASRLRAVAYLKELGLDHRIDPSWTSAEAIAQSRLALWLSQSEHFAIPPTRMECVDRRLMPWPGMEELQECFLFRFEYQLGEGFHHNLGFSGPISLAFPFAAERLDREELFWMFLAQDIDDPRAVRRSCDSDSEIQERTNDGSPSIDALTAMLHGVGLTEVAPIHFLEFLGHHALLAAARDAQGQPIRILIDGTLQTYAEHADTPSVENLLIARWMGGCARAILS